MTAIEWNRVVVVERAKAVAEIMGTAFYTPSCYLYKQQKAPANCFEGLTLST